MAINNRLYYKRHYVKFDTSFVTLYNLMYVFLFYHLPRNCQAETNFKQFTQKHWRLKHPTHPSTLF